MSRFSRVLGVGGVGRRRRRGGIVAETLRAGATVTEVARRRQICPQQVWGWRREAREGRLTLPVEVASTAELPSFVPIVTEHTERRSAMGSASGAVAAIEIRLAEAVVRVPAGTDPRLLGEVLRAVRASAR